MSDTSLQGAKSTISLIADADIVVQMVVLVLFMASIWSWAIIIEKWVTLRRIDKNTKYFEKAFSPERVELLYEKLKLCMVAPLEYAFVAFMNELKSTTMHSRASEDMRAAIEGAKAKEIAKLEGNLSYLAIIASSTPFIGLFGTVWGIMHSFQSIAASKNTSLAVVAPGIAEALFATALGLIAAIPALIFYNIFTAKVSAIENNVDVFSVELNKIASRALALQD